jgi:hypothetical protein
METMQSRVGDVRPQQGEDSGQEVPAPQVAPSAARAAPAKAVAARAAVRARRSMAAAVFVGVAGVAMLCKGTKSVVQLSRRSHDLGIGMCVLKKMRRRLSEGPLLPRCDAETTGAMEAGKRRAEGRIGGECMLGSP